MTRLIIGLIEYGVLYFRLILASAVMAGYGSFSECEMRVV